MTTQNMPPWAAHMQALANQAEARRTDVYGDTTTRTLTIRCGRRTGVENPARDIANAAADDTTGRTATHRRHGLVRTGSECRNCMVASSTLAEHQAGLCATCQEMAA